MVGCIDYFHCIGANDVKVVCRVQKLIELFEDIWMVPKFRFPRASTSYIANPELAS